MLSGTAAAAGIAWIDSVGNLAGYVSPELVKAVKAANSVGMALMVPAVALLAAGLVVLYVTSRKMRAQLKPTAVAPHA